MKILISTAVAITASVMTAPAQAAIITQAFEMVASDFRISSVFYAPDPIPVIKGTFSITFDNSSDVAATKVGLAVSNFFPADKFDLSFSYSKFYDALTVASDPRDYACGVSAPRFCFFLPNASSDLSPDGITTDNAYYSVKNRFDQDVYAVGKRQVTLLSAVPEPTTWAMMVAGFAVTGLALRRRTDRRKSIVA